MKWVYNNGAFIKEDKAYIPITDRGFLFGEGIFTTVRVSQGKAEFLSAHLARLYEQCAHIAIPCPSIRSEDVAQLIILNQAHNGMWRLKIIVTGSSRLLMTLQEYQMPLIWAMRLCTYPHAMSRPLAQVKSLSYLDQLLIYNYAEQQGYDDALILSPEGCVLETSCANFFWWNGTDLIVPDPTLPYMTGTVLSLLKQYIKVQYRRFTIQDLPQEAALYCCNAMTYIRPVIAIEKRTFERQFAFEQHLAALINQAREAAYVA